MRAFLVPFLIVLILLPQFQGQYSGLLPTNSVGLYGNRQVPLTIKLVFLGLTSSDINSTYLTAPINTPSEKSQAILAGPLGTGVTFKFNYQINFANSTVVSSLSSYLLSIQKSETTTIGGAGLRNPYFTNTTTRVSTVNGYFYDANLVETWFANSQSFGTAPIAGYTLFIADLHNVLASESMTYDQYSNYTTGCFGGSPCNRGDSRNTIVARVHYYNRTVVEPDLGLRETRHYMTGWGGDSRFQFLDLSAGPSYATDELPVQVASRLRNVTLPSPYGKVWLTEFVSDYLNGAVYNLFAADQIYPVNYSANYNFALFILDARTPSEKAVVPLQTTVNETMIHDQLSSLLPFAKVTITPKYYDLNTYPDLAAVVSSATTDIFDPAANDTIIDAKPVYTWLSKSGGNHISEFIAPRQNTEYLDIPALIFAFTDSYNFGFTFKSEVSLNSNPDSIYGVALGDMVLISHGQYDLTMGDHVIDGAPQPGKGIGYTHTIIHELGHMLGLAHPFHYDVTEDFVNSVMAYYPESMKYSQFDKDTILRGINDELLIYAQVTLANTSSTLFNSGQIASAQNAIKAADEKYGQMDYAGAVSDSLTAALSALRAHQTAGLVSPAILLLIVGLLIGSGLGILAGFLAFKRRPTTGLQYYRCPTCQSTLRWDPAMSRWYCDHCQKPV